jgi:hypothetical protein
VALQPSVGPWPLFQFLNLFTKSVGFLGWGSVRRKALPALRTELTQNKGTQTSMSQVRFEPTIPVFEQSKTVHTLDHAANVIGLIQHIDIQIRKSLIKSKYKFQVFALSSNLEFNKNRLFLKKIAEALKHRNAKNFTLWCISEIWINKAE